jgi:hypothetical protein
MLAHWLNPEHNQNDNNHENKLRREELGEQRLVRPLHPRHHQLERERDWAYFTSRNSCRNSLSTQNYESKHCDRRRSDQGWRSCC